MLVKPLPSRKISLCILQYTRGLNVVSADNFPHRNTLNQHDILWQRLLRKMQQPVVPPIYLFFVAETNTAHGGNTAIIIGEGSVCFGLSAADFDTAMFRGASCWLLCWTVFRAEVSQDYGRMMMRDGLCVYNTDAWCSHTVKVDGWCFPDLDHLIWRCWWLSPPSCCCCLTQIKCVYIYLYFNDCLWVW